MAALYAEHVVKQFLKELRFTKQSTFIRNAAEKNTAELAPWDWLREQSTLRRELAPIEDEHGFLKNPIPYTLTPLYLPSVDW